MGRVHNFIPGIMMTPNIFQQSSTQSSMHRSINFDTRSEADDHDEGDHFDLGAQTFGIQTRESSTSNISSLHIKSSILRAGNVCIDKTSSVSNEDKECVMCTTSDVPVCHVRLDQLENLKNSTKKLLCLLEEVQEKTHTTALYDDDPPKMSHVLKPVIKRDSDNLMKQSVSNIIGSEAMKTLEKHANCLDAIIIKDDSDDCSVYKRLTRKCHCLNQQEYNDLIIHFNEDTKFCTTAIGEIIKNLRILKKFLYMGGKYTINSLLFLNQGLEEGSHSEKSDIIQACAFADICCIFDTHTIVTVCISWPCKNPKYLEPPTQDLAAEFLYKMVKLEEGRRYLNFNSKITCDIKKVLKLKQDKINYDTIEMLNSILSLLQPLNDRFRSNNLTYNCRPVQEGKKNSQILQADSPYKGSKLKTDSSQTPIKEYRDEIVYKRSKIIPEYTDDGNLTLNALIAYRQYMTLNELLLHLDMLQTLSSKEGTKSELTTKLPKMLSLFKNLLIEFDNSEMNSIITDIMNNIVGEVNTKSSEKTGTIIVGQMLTCSTGTEPIKKKNANIQFPVPISHKKKHKKAGRPVSTLKLVTAAKSRGPRQPSRPKINFIQEINKMSSAIDEAIKRNVTSVRQLNDNPVRQKRFPTPNEVFRAVNRSQKFIGEDNRNVIKVPMDKENNKEI